MKFIFAFFLLTTAANATPNTEQTSVCLVISQLSEKIALARDAGFAIEDVHKYIAENVMRADIAALLVTEVYVRRAALNPADVATTILKDCLNQY